MSEEQKDNQSIPAAEAAPQAEQPTAPQQAPVTQQAPQQPPMGQTPPQPQPMYVAPQPQPQPQPMYPAPQPQPVYYPAPLMQLTGGMKFAWLVVGALLGVPGIVIAWLVNADKMPQVKSEALKYSIIGFVIWIVLGFLIGLAISGMMFAALGAMGSYGVSDYGYHGSW